MNNFGYWNLIKYIYIHSAHAILTNAVTSIIILKNPCTAQFLTLLQQGNKNEILGVMIKSTLHP